MQPNLGDVYPVNADRTLYWLYDTEERQKELKTNISFQICLYKYPQRTDDFPAPVLPQIPIFSLGFWIII